MVHTLFHKSNLRLFQDIFTFFQDFSNVLINTKGDDCKPYHTINVLHSKFNQRRREHTTNQHFEQDLTVAALSMVQYHELSNTAPLVHHMQISWLFSSQET